MGKLSFQGGLPRLFEIITHYGLTVLPINEVYLHTLIELPFTHRDPFDRLLVATAKADGLTILTKDENIPKYDVLTVW
jgi:PIN domain nuclease of toxin-antitoxin system